MIYKLCIIKISITHTYVTWATSLKLLWQPEYILITKDQLMYDISIVSDDNV